MTHGEALKFPEKKTISFEQFSKLVDEADFIEIGDDKAIHWNYNIDDRTQPISIETQEAVSIFASNHFPAEIVKDAVIVGDTEGYQCEVRFWRGVLIPPC